MNFLPLSYSFILVRVDPSNILGVLSQAMHMMPSSRPCILSTTLLLSIAVSHFAAANFSYSF